MAITQSLWGPTPSRFFRLLRRVEDNSSNVGRRSLAVLGCADGKYVLPAARQGFDVVAIDVDRIAIDGGWKPGPDSDAIWMPGLRERLMQANLSERVDVICDDFMKLQPREVDLAFTSGAIQYSRNADYTADEILGRLMAYVKPGGWFYADYLLPFEAKYKGRPNCPEVEWWRTHLKLLAGWEVVFNRVYPPTQDFPHVESPRGHMHQWGHALMRRS